MSETNEKLGGFPFVIGGLSFIPLLGIPFGIAALIWGSTTNKIGGKKLALLGGAGILLTLTLYGSLFYFGFAKRGGIYDDLRSRLAQNSLNTLVQAVEFYKVQHGSYPESLKALQESLPKDSMVFVNDPTDVKFSGKPKDFYYERVGTEHYYLRGVGPDGLPFTSDDILPQVQLTPGSKLGLLIDVKTFATAPSVPPATQPVTIPENASAPPTSATADNDASTFIALRYDKTHVLFRLRDSGDFYAKPEVEAMFHKLPASISEYGGSATSEPDAKIWDSIREHFDQAHVGEQWLLELSAGSRIPVTVLKPIELVWGCDYHSYSAGFIAEVSPPLKSAFAALPQNYFLIHKSPQVSGPAPSSEPAHVATLPDWTPAPEVRTQIEKAIAAALKDKLAREQARGYVDLPKQLEQNAALGKTKLTYEIQAFRLSPDGFPRLFVHARWMVDQQLAYLMNLWLRVGPEVKIEPLDGESSRGLWLSAKSGESLQEGEVGFGQLGQVLNVFDRADGYGDVLIYFRGEEGYDIRLFRYTDAGLVATKISHGDGC